jgi:U3 small nucleolar RNA-associated protein 21
MPDVQVRSFQGHRDRITDVCISANSKWVISAAMDVTLRVWDIPSACCVQAMHVGCPITALSFAPNMELLATTHVNRKGIYLWSNSLLFGGGAGMIHTTFRGL